MSMFDDIPEWRLEQIYADMRKKRREQLSEKLGREIAPWGGPRPGSGRPKTKTVAEFNLKLNPVQRKILTEMGDGDIDAGIMKLINENM